MSDMELCSDGSFEEEIVTNDSFVGNALSRLFREVGDSSSTMYHPQGQDPTPHSRPQMIALPLGPPPPPPLEPLTRVPLHNQSVNHEPLTTTMKTAISQPGILSFLQLLFPITAEDIAKEGFLKLTSSIVAILKNLNEFEKDEFRSLLSGHIGVYEDGHPWVDLEAAYLLQFSDLFWKSVTPGSIPSSLKLCPQMKAALQDGRYIPMQHVLHCLSIFHFHSDVKYYPFKVSDPVPLDFLNKIKRTDVIRGANVHCLLVGMKFPLVAVRFPALVDELWCFMFAKKFSAAAGMELYNEFFFEFTRQLAQANLPSVEDILSHVIESVSRRSLEL